MPKQLTCDICGSDKNPTEDYDGQILCEYHRTFEDLRQARRDYWEFSFWLHDTYLKELSDKKELVDKLRKKLKTLEAP